MLVVPLFLQYNYNFIQPIANQLNVALLLTFRN
uniref:Uncharacterized protein n=1 Tax=Klebsiella phage FKP3 TaxID=3231233 RepID=A0AAU8HZB7_9CAUD